MKKFLNILWKSLLWFTGILLALMLVAVSLLYFYKDKIIDLTVTEINKYLNTKVVIDPQIDFSIIDKFPQVYIQFHNVKVYESTPKSEALLGELRSIYITFDVLKIWKGEYSINHIYLEHGHVHLKVDEQGNNNYDIIKRDTSSKGGAVGFHLNRIELNDISLRYENRLTRQDHQVEARSCVASLHAEKEQYRIGLKGDLHVHAIHVNSSDYFTQKDIKLESDMIYSVPDSSFRILPSSLKVQDANFNIQGRYEFSQRNSIDLSISAGQSNVHTLISLMPESMEESMREYKSSGQVYFDAEIHGIISDTENPKVDINFGFSRASIYHPTIPYRIEYAYMKGLFTNGEKRNASTWTLQLDSLSGYLAGKKFAGNFYMKNFDHPFVKFDLETTQDVKSVLAFYPVKAITEASGEITAKIHFEGNLEDLQNKEKQQNIISSGQIVLNNVDFKLKDYTYPFTGFRGVFVFDRNDVEVVDFMGKAGQSDFALNGIFRNVLAKLIYDKGQTVIDAELNCKYVNASELLKGTDTGSDSIPTRPVTLIPEGYAFNLKTTVGKLDYEKFNARKLTGQLQYSSKVLKFTNFSCNVAGGKMALDSRLDLTSTTIIRTSTTAEFTDIRVDSIFYMFDEFSQSFLTSENIKGNFTGKVNMLLNMDHLLNIDNNSIVAEIDATVRNGQLVNFGPMQAISTFIDEKELANVKFSELKNKIYITNGVIDIPEMEIRSNVSNIRISGKHSFTNEMDYKIAVPLKNFKLSKFSFSKKDTDAAIEEKNGGATVYLTLKGTAENYKVALDKERTVAKIKQDLGKEKQEFKDAFKKQQENVKDVQLQEEEYFDFE